MLSHVTILERDPVVAQDIGTTVVDMFPGVPTTFATSISKTCDNILARHDYLGLAIVRATRAELETPILIDALRQTRSRILAISQPMQDAAYVDWSFLAPPFTTPDLEAALRRLTLD